MPLKTVASSSSINRARTGFARVESASFRRPELPRLSRGGPALFLRAASPGRIRRTIATQFKEQHGRRQLPGVSLQRTREAIKILLGAFALRRCVVEQPMLRSNHRDQLLAGSLPEGPAVFHRRTAENETVQGRPDGNRIALVRKQVDNLARWREIIYI